MTPSRLLIAALILLLIVFAAGVVDLFILRFEGGDIYPPYSSLRADPLGTKAYFQSLEKVGLAVVRNFEAPEKRALGPSTTIFFAGIGDSEWTSEAQALAMESLAAAGSRVIVTFDPVSGSAARQRVLAGNKGPGAAGAEAQSVSMARRWGCEFLYAPLKRDADGRYEALSAELSEDAERNDLEPSVSWHSSLYFKSLNAAWKIQYGIEERAVLMERKFGAGTLVIASDSFFLSNEALKTERKPKLLSWLIGGHREVTFDETHHGIAATPGIAALIRKYRLHGLVGSLLLLAGLFLWKAGAQFVPPADPLEAEGASLDGRDAAAGLANLLQRGIDSRELLKVCFSEWKKSFLSTRRDLKKRIEHAQTVVEPPVTAARTSKTPVALYARITRILNEKEGSSS